MKRVGSLIVLLVVAVVLVGCSVPITTTGQLRGYIYVRETSPIQATALEGGEIVFSDSSIPPYGYIPVRQAQVFARNASTGKLTARNTDYNGHFHFGDLRPGTYTISVNGGSLWFDVVEPNVEVTGFGTDWLVRGTSGGRGYYVVIGIENYKDYEPVPGPRKDAEDVYDTLVMDNGLASYGSLLINEEATKKNIEKAVSKAVAAARRTNNYNDYLVIYFAGISGKDYLSPWDDNDSDWRNAITDGELERWVRDFPGSVTLILDGAESATMADRNVLYPTAFEKPGKRYTVLAGAQEGELVNYDPDLRNSVFTYYLLEGIRTRGADRDPWDGNITAWELFNYTAEQMEYYYPGAADAHVPSFYAGIVEDTAIYRY